MCQGGNVLSSKWHLAYRGLVILTYLLATVSCGGSPTSPVVTATPIPPRPFLCRPDTQTIRLGDLAYFVAANQGETDPEIVKMLDAEWDVSDGAPRAELFGLDQPWALVALYPRTGTFDVALRRKGDLSRTTSICKVIVLPREP